MQHPPCAAGRSADACLRFYGNTKELGALRSALHADRPSQSGDRRGSIEALTELSVIVYRRIESNDRIKR